MTSKMVSPMQSNAVISDAVPQAVVAGSSKHDEPTLSELEARACDLADGLVVQVRQAASFQDVCDVPEVSCMPPSSHGRRDGMRSDPEAITQDAILVEGPSGRVERIRINRADSPQAIEHCLRVVFSIAQDANFVLRDSIGCVTPLGLGLVLTGTLRIETPEDVCGFKPTYRLHLLDDDSHRPVQMFQKKRRALAPLQQLSIPEEMRDGVADDECQFWCALVSGFEKDDSGVSKQFWKMAKFDTSPHRMDNLFQQWADVEGGISPEALRNLVAKEHKIKLDEQQTIEAVQRARGHLRRGLPGSEFTRCSTPDGTVSRQLFETLWQRLMLGVVCKEARLQRPRSLTEQDIGLYEFSERVFKKEFTSEQALFFALAPLNGNGDDISQPNLLTRWARVDKSGPDRVVRMAVKFFLHPLATEDAVDTMTMGLTKIDRYRQQYFVSLEVYALDVDISCFEEDTEPPKVTDHVVRSTLFLIVTGNPRNVNVRSGVGYRDWLLSLVNCDTADIIKDPLDCFTRDTTAATRMLDRIAQELKSHGRLREYMADFLLYTILDRSVGEMNKICLAYGYRLCWLAERLKSEKMALPTAYVDEVSRIRLELKELQHWVHQMMAIVRSLQDDCRGITDGSAGSDAPWCFGAKAVGSGKSLLLFIKDTKGALQHTADRLAVFEELTRTFADDHRRHTEVALNEILFILAFMSAVFLPAQFLAGVYGMNFTTDDGRPAAPELRLENGYWYFWAVSGALVLIMAGVICTVRRRQRRCYCRCCRYRRPRKVVPD